MRYKLGSTIGYRTVPSSSSANGVWSISDVYYARKGSAWPQAYVPLEGFSPAALFAAGEQGVWYDPSDLSTMFEDAAGTVPVHTPGNGTADSPVGLLLDKHSNAVGTNGASRYNLLTYTEDFSNSQYTKSGYTISTNTITAPDGTSTADSVYETNANANHWMYGNIGQNSTVSYTVSVALKSGLGRDWVKVCFDGATNNGVYFNITDGNVGNADSGFTGSIASLGNGWYRCTITNTPSASGPNYYFIIASAVSNGGSMSYIGDVTKGFYIWGADVRLSSQAALTPTYQKITSDWASTMAGNHATQPTSTARPTLSAKYNLLTYTEQFDNAYWRKADSSTTDNSTTAPDGTTTADTLTDNTVGAYHFLELASVFTSSAANYTFTICLKQGTIRYAGIHVYDGTARGCSIDLQTGTLGTPYGSATASVTDLGNGWYRLKVTATMVATATAQVAIYMANSNSLAPYTGTGTGTIYVWGADLRVSNDGVGLPAYQRVADANTYDSTGFPYYLKFDGTDDILSVSSGLGLASTNQATAFSSSRLFSGGASYPNLYGIQGNGGFGVYYSGPTTQIGAWSKGTVINVLVGSPTISRPISCVLTQVAEIATPLLKLTFNGSTVLIDSSASQGTGNYSNSAFDLGGNSTGSNALQGRIYGMILRGASSTTNEIAATENWLNAIAKIY